MSQSTFQDVLISEIKENPVALRSVDKDSEQYQNLVHDIGRRGVLKPIIARQSTDDTTGETYYELCDGLQRYSAAKDNGLERIPVRVMDLSDAEVEETQIVANLCKVDTKPVEYSNQLKRMLQRNSTMTISELAEMISQSTAFVSQRLNLLKLHPEVQKLVDDGDIVLSNGVALAKLPDSEQLNYTDQAMTQSPAEFVQTVGARVKELREAAKQGKEAEAPSFKPTKKLRKVREFEQELDSGTVGPSICSQLGASSAAEGFAAAVQWALSLDPDTVEVQREKFDARQREKEEAAAKRKAAREAKRAKEAAEKAAAAREAAGLTEDDVKAELAAKEQAAKEAASK